MRPEPTAALILLAAALSGCAAYDVYRKCGLHGCPGDPEISAEVRALIDQHPELRPPNLVYVKTLDRVVYLDGEVVTDVQRATAEAAARSAPGARAVVDSIALSYNGR